MSRPCLVWFRRDLRLEDLPSLQAAVERGTPLIPVFILHDDDEGEWTAGSASRWWLHHSLLALQAELRERGSRLILRSGTAETVLADLVAETNADAVVWTRRYEPRSIETDTAIKESLRKQGLSVQSYPGSLLIEPWTLKNREGRPFQVFTPFWKALAERVPVEPLLEAPHSLKRPGRWPESEQLETWGLLPKIPWDAGMRDLWNPGSQGAHARWETFRRESSLDEYREQRDRPDVTGTSRLSPHLHFGEISPGRLWRETCGKTVRPSDLSPGRETFLKELAWREFAHYLLYHFPSTPAAPFRDAFRTFPWTESGDALSAWQHGRTGYPSVDAGMRELWTTGWMHNRVRMIVASFLTKHLLISWQCGAAWFWDTLVDADLANNTLGWQWTAGCGADAAPYFRIFNPMLQGAKFDPEGSYVRKWVPELAGLPAEWIHAPWTAPGQVLKKAGIELGRSYPWPIVDHAEARQRALDAFARIQSR